MQQRKKSTKEFKLDAVSLVTDQGYRRIDAARSLGINANMLGRWVKEFNQDDGQSFRGNGKLTAEQEEIRKLKVQFKRLEMVHWVKKIAEATDDSYGSRRMKKALNLLGLPVSRNKAKNLMKAAGVKVRHKKKYKVTTDSNHKQPVFENLIQRAFDVEQPDQVYAADVTYIWTQEGWLYLAVVIDLFSRKVVGWSMSSRMKAQLVCDVLKMAIWRHRPKAGLIHHSDRGSQYASKAFRQLLKTHGIKGSMSRKGDCWDNAVVESFFGSLKQERVQWRNYQTRYEAQQDILQYISVFYNNYRLHSTLDYVSLHEYERQFNEMKKVA